MRRAFVCGSLLLAVAGSSSALVKEAGTGRGAALREIPWQEPVPSLVAVETLGLEMRVRRQAELDRLGVPPNTALLDTATGRWATLLSALPLIPGAGVGNTLTWGELDLERPAGDEALGRQTWELLTTYIARHSSMLGIEVEELRPRQEVFESGELIQFSASRGFFGLPVRGAVVTAVINHGNLVLLGSRNWGDITLDTVPSLGGDMARQVVSDHLGHREMGEATASSTLAILPSRASGASALGHRLVWVVPVSISGDRGRWEALVDAHDGELLSLEDLNHYGSARNVHGGVYPASSDGIPPDGSLVAGYPMPFADLDVGGFTDAGGNFDAAGAVTTTLAGQFVLINDGCGAISESSTGDIDLEGADGDTDCDVPPGHSPGDTAGARTAYYEINRIREMAVGQLPANAWLGSQLLTNTNINATCGAFWNGTSLNFYRNNAGPCENVAQLAGVIDHEWGHGMDDNDVEGSIPSVSQGGGEGLADLMAAFRGNASCVGRGFFTAGTLCSGYGDPCTVASGCTGVRTVDYADRESGLPHDLDWVRNFCISDAPQCLGAAYSEAVWDLAKRDLPALYGMDDNTARELVTRLLFVAGGALTGWFDLNGPAPGDAGCGASQAYLQFLAADDDDGDIDNGTPHMTAIAAAFDRLGIGCTPGGATPGPTVQDSGCAPTPTTAPVVTAAAVDRGAHLSWTAVADAAEYRIYRTDGERLCGLGKALVGMTSGLAFSDSGLKNERPYSYVVVPMGVDGASCFGPASDCVTVGEAHIFSDGFESGDTTAWTNSVP